MNLFLLLLIHLFSIAQDQDTMTLLKRIESDADLMSSDHLGNVYLVKDNFLWKYNPEKDSLMSYNSKQYGDISFVDATNPYKILVFHRDYAMLQFLDNFLSQNASAINLQEIQFDQAELVCHSRENGFWVYDWTLQKIVRIDRNFQPTHESVNLKQWFGNNFQPNFMLEYNQRLYLNEPSRGVLVFDQFATYIKTIPLLKLESLQIKEKAIYFVEEGQFCNYNLESLEKKCIPLFTENLKDVRIEKNRLFVLEEGKLSIYQLE